MEVDGKPSIICLCPWSVVEYVTLRVTSYPGLGSVWKEGVSVLGLAEAKKTKNSG